MPQPVNLAFAFGLPPEKALEYFRSKGYAIGWNWQDVWQEAQARAFTVARVTRLDVLEDIRNALLRTLTEGTTLAQFRRELEPLLRAKGWWGSQVVVGADGGAEVVQLGSARRLRTIYHTNVQTAMMAGRYASMMEETTTFPYWQYIAVMDARTRPSHAALNGLVFRFDDPFWDSFYPPNGFNCRCRVRPLMQSQVDREGLTVRSSEGELVENQVIAGTDKRTGEQRIADVTGIKVAGADGRRRTVWTDAGWNYNPGRAAFQPDLDRYAFEVARQYIEGGLTGPDFARFFAGKDAANFPVAVLNESYRRLIGANTQTVLLSAESLVKNIRHHPELTLADYQRLPSIIQNAALIVAEGDLVIIFVDDQGKFYYAVVKSTRDGRELYLTSLRITNSRDIENLIASGTVLRNELGQIGGGSTARRSG